MTKKETDKLYSDIVKKFHPQSTFMKKHYYHEINNLLNIGVPIENIEWYFTVYEAINAIRETQIEAEIRGDVPPLLEDDEIQEWWRKVYEVLGVDPKELLKTEQKSNGGATLAPIVPIKIEYGDRFSDDFLTAAEEEALDLIEA